ncbi:MAG TPA: hypothetical protein VMR25_04990, partial [Planctomycetaceae bacterium]|nr:hypothetical protein [Planctomycetaceae bacterium]
MKIHTLIALVFALLTPCLYAESPADADKSSAPSTDVPAAATPNPAPATPLPPMQTSPAGTPQSNDLPPTNEPSDMASIQFWGGGVYGQGPVQDRSILPVEMFPFFRMDESLYFSDLRF